MTREQLTNLLTESGVENPSKLLISAILNSFQEERNEAVKTAVQEAETRVKEQFKDYKTPDEFKALADENATLKDSEAKTARIAKYRGKGINEKYFDYADNVLKSEKDLDAKLEEANKVLDVMIGMLKKKKQLRTLDEAAVWIDVVIAAGLIHNLFYDGSITSLFKAREVLTDKAKEYKVPDNAISAMFQTVECQLGDDTPIPGCIPVSSTPNELFAWSCWFAKEYDNKEW